MFLKIAIAFLNIILTFNELTRMGFQKQSHKNITKWLHWILSGEAKSILHPNIPSTSLQALVLVHIQRKPPGNTARRSRFLAHTHLNNNLSTPNIGASETFKGLKVWTNYAVKEGQKTYYWSLNVYTYKLWNAELLITCIFTSKINQSTLLKWFW